MNNPFKENDIVIIRNADKLRSGIVTRTFGDNRCYVANEGESGQGRIRYISQLRKVADWSEAVKVCEEANVWVEAADAAVRKSEEQVLAVFQALA